MRLRPPAVGRTRTWSEPSRAPEDLRLAASFRGPDNRGGVAEEVLDLALVPVRRVLLANRAREAQPLRERVDAPARRVPVAEADALVTVVVDLASVAQQH